MADIPRVSAAETRSRVQAGNTLLVCAYSSDEKFSAHHLEGAISYAAFQAMKPTLEKSRELVFFCA